MRLVLLKCFLFSTLLMLFNLSADAKDIKIHRCLLANGTLAFQEQPCLSKKIVKSNKESRYSRVKNHNKKITSQQKSVSNRATRYNVRQDSVSYSSFQKIANVDKNDISSTVIYASVKGYLVSFKVMKRWKMIKKVFNNKLLHIKLKDDSRHDKMSLLMDFIFPDNKKFSDKELLDMVHLLGSQYIKGSREGSVQASLLTIENGKGAMAIFTNSSKVSKFTYTSKGVIFKGNWLIHFTLLSNKLNSINQNFILSALKHAIKIKPDGK